MRPIAGGDLKSVKQMEESNCRFKIFLLVGRGVLLNHMAQTALERKLQDVSPSIEISSHHGNNLPSPI